jgi:rubrerythrin
MSRWRLAGAAVLAAALGAGLLAPAGRAAEGDDALADAMAAALQDEWRAEAFYEAVMAVHGEVRPFSKIVRAEGRHAGALLALHERLGMTPPDNEWAGAEFDVPETLEACCDLAASGEVANVALYDEWLETIDHEDARGVFASLRQASAERHLAAFRACGSGWEEVEIESMDKRQSRQRQWAESAQRELFGRVFAELRKAMAGGDVASAIEVCKDKAPPLAGEVGERRKVRIGRTSFRLRNPENTPPPWAVGYVDRRVERAHYLAARDGRLAALLPIRTMSLCLGCHGGEDDLAPGVPERLAELYPDDRATGFGNNALRGWFWVEVPPPVGD